MPSAYLAINSRSGTPQVKRYNGLSASLVGNSVTGSTANTFFENDQPVNRVIQFAGANTFLTVLGVNSTTSAVFRSTDGGNTWTNVYQFTVGSGLGRLVSGLNIAYSNGIPLVIFTSYPDSSTIQGYRSTDGVNWVADATVAMPFAANVGITTGPTSELVFGSTLYWTANFGGNQSGGIIAYSPGSISYTSTTGVFTSSTGAATSLCVFNNNIMILGIGNASSDTGKRILAVLEGGVVVQVAVLASLVAGFNAGWKTSMLVDGSNLYCFFPGGSTGTWNCYQVDSNYTSTNLTNTVLPLGMTSANIASDARSLTWVDGQVSPGANPTKYLIFANGSTANSPLVLYQWVNSSTRMQVIDSGGVVSDAMSLNKNVEGSTFWTSGENHIELVNRSAVSGGIRLLFNLYSGTGSTPTVNVRVWYGEQLEVYPTNPATLSNPTSGAITGGGLINSGVVINNGASTYEVTWESTADGVSVGTRTLIVLEVFI